MTVVNKLQAIGGKLRTVGNKLVNFSKKCCCEIGKYWTGEECKQNVDCQECTETDTHYDGNLNMCVPNCSVQVCDPSHHWDPLLCRCMPNCLVPGECEEDEHWDYQVCGCIQTCCPQTCAEGSQWDHIKCMCVPLHYKCDTALEICEKTDEDITEPNVYDSLDTCVEQCMGECQVTEGCAFEVQFYAGPDVGGHCCNRATFDVYAGEDKIGNINLNNAPECSDVSSEWILVTADHFNINTCSYNISLRCTTPGGCHTGVAGIRFKRPDDTEIDAGPRPGDTWEIGANLLCTDTTYETQKPLQYKSLKPKINKSELYAILNNPKNLEICQGCAAFNSQTSACRISEKPWNAQHCPIDKWLAKPAYT